MTGLMNLLLGFVRDCFRSRGHLYAEILVLRHQLDILRRKTPKRFVFSITDWALSAWLYRVRPAFLNAPVIVQPETVIQWHHSGRRAWWRWKSRNRGGCPTINAELRDLIRQLCGDSPLWGAPHIHGELLKLGFEFARSTVSNYMVRRRRPPSNVFMS